MVYDATASRRCQVSVTQAISRFPNRLNRVYRQDYVSIVTFVVRSL